MTSPERVPNEVLVELDRQQRGADLRKQAAETARMVATERISIAALKVVDVLEAALEDEDPQVRLRASEILLSRSISKIAAKHATLSDEETVDTVDVQALRESILAEVQKRR